MGWAAHAAKIALNELAGADHHVSTMLFVGRRHRIEHDAADALWVISQHDQRELRSVRDPVDIPAVDAQCHLAARRCRRRSRCCCTQRGRRPWRPDWSRHSLIAAAADGGGRFRREGEADRVVYELLARAGKAHYLDAPALLETARVREDRRTTAGHGLNALASPC